MSKQYIIERCQRLGIIFRCNKQATKYRFKYILISESRGCVGFNYLTDVDHYLDLFEFSDDFLMVYSDQEFPEDYA